MQSFWKEPDETLGPLAAARDSIRDIHSNRLAYQYRSLVNRASDPDSEYYDTDDYEPDLPRSFAESLGLPHSSSFSDSNMIELDEVSGDMQSTHSLVDAMTEWFDRNKELYKDSDQSEEFIQEEVEEEY